MNTLRVQSASLPGGRVVHQQCLACGHAWVDYEGKRLTCFLCASEKLSPPVALSRIREVLDEAQKQVAAGTLTAAELDDRKARLMERYRKAAPVFAQRADETFGRVSARYLDGDLSDRCLDALVFSFHLFTELGLNDAAVRCALMIASGYFRRVQDKDIQAFTDLADLAAARQWFLHLGQLEWVATVDLLTGLKAGHTVLEHVRDKYVLLQISRVHLDRARQYCADKNLPDIQRRVEKESDWINQQLSHAIGAAAQIEAAHIHAQSRLDAAEIIGRRLDAMSEQIQGLSSSVSTGFGQLASGLANGLDALGQRIDLAGGRVSEALAWGSKYLGDRVLAGAGMVSGSIAYHAGETRKGMHDLGTEVRKSIDSAGDKAVGAMSGMGTKIALGAVGAGALNAFILDGTLKQLAGAVTPQIRQGLEGLKLAAAPLHNAAPTTLQDVLVLQGLDEVNRRVRDYGITVERAKQNGG